MADSSTPFLDLTKPEVGASADSWGDKLNTDLGLIDDAIQSLVEGANYAAASGVDTITVSLDPGPQSLNAGLGVRFKAAGANTVSPTLNVNGLGAKSIKYPGGASLAAGALQSGVIYQVDYDGTDFILSGIGLASSAEVLAGTDGAKAISPAAFAANKSLSTEGYFRLPGGFTIQWGAYSSAVTSESTVNVTFPVAFSSACVFAEMTAVNSSAASNNDGFFQQVTKSTTGASFRAQDVANTITGNWLAIGY